ncbi:MAG: hypothetical protein LBM97_02470 [Candidatus Nomurabacteria bacterium]|jgi:hypothetical protein|nr:hypothetical protein [Candidatus Nomurabacteria bacterium]
MGILLFDEEEKSGLRQRIAMEMRQKMEENGLDEGRAPEIDDAVDSVYLETFDKKKDNPYFWRIVIMIAVVLAIICGFIFFVLK